MMKGHPYKPKKHLLAGQYVSEKLDGFRFFWDGGVSRGLTTSMVPYANTEKDKKETTATGLWSQNCKVIYAPSWFLNHLPRFPLDGEIWGGRGNFQSTISIGKTQDFSGDWAKVHCAVLDIPDPRIILSDGVIDEPHFKKTLNGCDAWWMSRRPNLTLPHMASTFRERLSWLGKNLVISESVRLHEQYLLPPNTPKAKAIYDKFMDEVLEGRGEGLILKSPICYWLPERNDDTHKCKPYDDMEATVVGYTSGEETDKGSKLLGLMGALICKIPSGRFKVSGFKNEERVLSTSDFPAGVELPTTVTSELFPRGSVVTVRYRELTEAGIPKEARYYRKRGDR